jgi:hypothetical protein
MDRIRKGFNFPVLPRLLNLDNPVHPVYFLLALLRTLNLIYAGEVFFALISIPRRMKSWHE